MTTYQIEKAVSQALDLPRVEADLLIARTNAARDTMELHRFLDWYGADLEGCTDMTHFNRVVFALRSRHTSQEA